MTWCLRYTGGMEHYLTLREAAARLGRTDTSTFRHAIKKGVLQAVRRGGSYFTTQAWLDAYVTHVEATRGGKGKKREPGKRRDDGNEDTKR